MKRFYINAIAFAVLFIAILVGVDFLSMHGNTRTLLAKLTNSEEYISGNVGADEIKPYIERAETEDQSTKLIIGDSVCRQMFNGLQALNPDFMIIGSNGAITMAGQYILAKDYLDTHPNATDIFLILLPKSISRSYDTKWGYQYVVMPFVETNKMGYLDQSTIDCLGNTYGKPFLNPGVVECIDKSAINRKLYLNMLKDRTEGYKPEDPFELADQYVWKIYEMCTEKNVAFHFYSCPVSEASAKLVDSLKEPFAKSKVREINPEFLSMVLYYPAEEAKDKTHFSGEYATQENYNEKIRKMYEGRELLDMLKLE